MAAWLVAWFVVGSAACAIEHRVVVTGYALYATVGERREKGKAEVPASDISEGDEDEGEPPKYVATTATVARGARLGLEGGKISLEELERGCVGQTPGAPPPDESKCTLRQYDEAMFTVRRYDERLVPVTRIVAYSALAGIGAAATCELACRDGSTEKAVSGGVLVALGSLLAAGLVWALFDCMGKWGQPGCRD